MNSDIIMIFAQGFTFLGKFIEGSLILKDAVQLVIIFQNDGSPINVPMKIGDITLPSSYPSTKISTQSRLYRDYVKITTGIDIPDMKAH